MPNPPFIAPLVRTKYHKRHAKRGGVVHTVAVSPEALLSSHEKHAKRLAGPSAKPCPVNRNDGLPVTNWEDRRELRSRKARGHIKAIIKLTGEDPNAIMARIGLTTEEISHIAPFRKIVVWE